MLTFAGEELLFPTPELEAWILRNQDLSDLSPFADQPGAILSPRRGLRSRFEQTKGIGLPIMNWPPAPPVRLNTLYWPTGATRWARGWFLATRETRNAIIHKVHKDGNNNAATLRIGDDSGDDPYGPLALDMFMLPPRPMSDESLYLIPLVDERYFWQFMPFKNSVGDNVIITTSTTWADLIQDLGIALDVTITIDGDPASEYMKPDVIDFTRNFDNCALLLDAAAYSFGHRIVRRFDGTVHCEDVDNAAERLVANTDLECEELAGGDFSLSGGENAETLLVTFRKITQFLLRSDDQQYTIEKQPPADGRAHIKGKSIRILSAAYADYDTSNTLLNGTALDSLAEKISHDYYEWNSLDYDYTFKGIVPWVPSGFDDSILWTFGRLSAVESYDLGRDDDGAADSIRCNRDHLAQTRVQTLPPNFFAETHLASDPAAFIIEPRQIGKASAAIANEDHGTVRIWAGDAGSESDTGLDVDAWNHGPAIDNGAWVTLEGEGDAQWYASRAPNAGSLKTLYYCLAKPVKGFVTVSSLHVIKPANPIAWPGATFLVGDESAVGVSFDNAETSPDTNGNFNIDKAGLYRVEVTGQVRMSYGTTWNAGEYLIVVLQTYLKPSGGSIATLTDSAGQTIGAFAIRSIAWNTPAGISPANPNNVVEVSFLFERHFDQNDRLAFALDGASFGGITGTDPWISIEGYYQNLMLHFTYLDSADQLSSHTSF